ncbi:MAG TPA: galactokinase [Chryseosolibacter sp.]|nr:galactokinase [Chryseosolibacter sp.]
MEISARDIQARFQELFKKEPLIIRAPGRINLIGEHTDYNDGFVMPAAVDKEIFFGIAASDDSRSVVYSLKYDERFEINLEDPRPVEEPRWANYLLGVLYQFKEHGYPVKPFNCVFGGNIPLGAGMSSSAAMECGFGTALSEYHLLNVPKSDIITMSQWAEHHYVGVKCGIMDQFASVMSKAGHVIVLDCREMTHRYAPLDLQGYGIVLCDTKVKHSLVDSEYNRRRAECESGLKILQKYYPSVKSLRDVSLHMLSEHEIELQGKIYQRCRYVVEEIERVQIASEDLRRGDLVAFGKKMYETHEGLSNDYEVSCPELDFLVDQAKQTDYVIGARMMGGGFGGCTINLVKREESRNFIEQMRSRYKTKFDIDMPAYRVNVVDGAGKVKDSDLVLWT